MRIIKYRSREAMRSELCRCTISGLKSALLEGADTALLAVPGGSTPAPFFTELCQAQIEWSRIMVVPTDERWVAETSEDSNSRMIRETLLAKQVSKARFLSIYSENESIEERVNSLDEGLLQFLPLAVLVLGMGTDMHTASLFPGADGLERTLASDAPPFLPVRQQGGGPVEQRMSMTLPVLNGAREKHLMIVGSEKLTALERAKEINDPMLAPIVAVFPDLTVHWAK